MPVPADPRTLHVCLKGPWADACGSPSGPPPGIDMNGSTARRRVVDPVAAVFPRSCLVFLKTRPFARAFPAPRDFQKQFDLWGQPWAPAVAGSNPASPTIPEIHARCFTLMC